MKERGGGCSGKSRTACADSEVLGTKVGGDLREALGKCRQCGPEHAQCVRQGKGVRKGVVLGHVGVTRVRGPTTACGGRVGSGVSGGGRARRGRRRAGRRGRWRRTRGRTARGRDSEASRAPAGVLGSARAVSKGGGGGRAGAGSRGRRCGRCGGRDGSRGSCVGGRGCTAARNVALDFGALGAVEAGKQRIDGSVAWGRGGYRVLA